MRAIRRSEEFENLVQKLGNTEHPVTKKSLFPTIRDVICFAGILGFEHDPRKPLSSNTNEVDARIWSNSQQALDLVYLIALASEKDGEILREENEDKMVQIFEEYAQGGLEIVESWMKQSPFDQNGDQALLVAFKAHGFLDQSTDSEIAIPDISF